MYIFVIMILSQPKLSQVGPNPFAIHYGNIATGRLCIVVNCNQQKNECVFLKSLDRFLLVKLRSCLKMDKKELY